MRGLIARLALPLVVIASACTEGFQERFTSDRAVAPEARFVADAMPQFLDVPFPSDVYLRDGRYVTIPGLARVFRRNTDVLAQQLEKTSGWSRIAGAVFTIDDPLSTTSDETGERHTLPVEIDSLPADEKECMSDGSAVFLIDLESGQRIPCRGMSYDGSESGDRSVLGVGPARGVVLAEGHAYAAVVTSRVRARGAHIVASRDFDAAARGEGPLGSLYGPAYAKVMAAIGSGLGNERVVAIAPYTTQKVTDELYAMRDALEAAPAPALKWDAPSLAPMAAAKFTTVTPLPSGFTATMNQWLGVHPGPKLSDGSDDTDTTLPVRGHDKIRTFATAVFDGVNYLRVRSTKYEDLEHGTFARDASGKPMPAPEKPTSKIWVTFMVPTAPMPTGGYPVVVMQHGLESSRAFLLEFGNRFCAKGWMVVGIDAVTFGARANDPKYQVDADNEYAGTYSGPDGLSDLVVVEQGPPVKKERARATDFFGALKNVRALGDQLRQAAFDTAQLVKVLRSSPNLAPLDTGTGVPQIDVDKIVYVGDSFGGIQGALAAAIEPRLKAWALNVAGGGVFTEIGAHGPSIHAQLALAGNANFDVRSRQYSESHPLVVVGQTLSEAGDPIAYAKHIVVAPRPLVGQPTPKRNVFQTEVLYDELVADEGCEALARAGGWGLTGPNVPNSGLADLGTKKPYRGGGIVLPEIASDNGGYRNTPEPGVTAVLVQVDGAHGYNIVRSTGNRRFDVPYNATSGRLRLEDKGPDFVVPCTHNVLLDAIVGFFEEAMAGQVPAVRGIPPARRDTDGDGSVDGADRSPIDRAVQ